MIRRLPEAELLKKLLPLTAVGPHRPSVHVFDERSIKAVNVAIDCGRPLLVRGEPGTGKSQLARAVAQVLERVFVSVFVDARTEAHDLLWFHDAVTRLAEAQAWTKGEDKGEDDQGAAKDLARLRYVLPRALWWALDWKGAHGHATNVAAIKEPPPAYTKPSDPANGVVLLIDEIDKADSSVPNGLLECLGQGTFSVPGLAHPVHATGPAPLVVLTTNEDRVLPDAFMRRCVVLHLRVPDPRQWKGLDDDELVKWLVKRGRAHFEDLEGELLEEAATQVQADRDAMRDRGSCPPGLAEYIDLLTAVHEGRAAGDDVRVQDIAGFVLRKHVEPWARHDSHLREWDE
ncbi:MAG: MoxR family ATPase [Nannocystaceae bacterium]